MTVSPESHPSPDFDLDDARKILEIMKLNPFVSAIGRIHDIQERLRMFFACVPFHLCVSTHKEFESPLDKLKNGSEYLENFPGYQEMREEIEAAKAILAREWDPRFAKFLRSFVNDIVYVVIFWDSFMMAYQYKTTVTCLLGMGRNKVFFHLDRLGLKPRSFANVDSLLTLIERSDKLRAMREEIQRFIQEEEQS